MYTMRPSVSTGYGSESKLRNGAISRTRSRTSRWNMIRDSGVTKLEINRFQSPKRAANAAFFNHESMTTPPLPS